ncbi:hypothetical protein [Desulfuromonas acetoxidans]|uniref:hypothetical protein n=1 Tax=Desulfuromonas acetoxidans TaxID=891 RepID=UPI00292E9188|nr:hypothetical protein [Desulfuromonas acetoxidans]
MARHATINFTSEVLALIDLHAQKNKSNRSAVVRDACLSYLDQEGDKSFALIKLEQRNAETLRRLASLFSKDHDKFLNDFLGEILADFEAKLKEEWPEES